jgi:hypothetical protein
MQPTAIWVGNFHDHASLRGLDRLRALLVLATDDDYAAARAAAQRVRDGGTDGQRVASSFLFPTEQAWVKADAPLMTAKPGFKVLLASIADVGDVPASFALTIDTFIPHRYQRARDSGDLAACVLDGCGTGAAALLARVDVGGYVDADMLRLWYITLAAVGHDDAIAVVAKALAHKEAQAALAGANQPRRVLRMVAKAAAARGKAGDGPRAVLGMVVRRSPELIAEVRPFLDKDGARAVDAVVADVGEALPDAPPACSRPFCKSRPGARRRRRPKGRRPR